MRQRLASLALLSLAAPALLGAQSTTAATPVQLITRAVNAMGGAGTLDSIRNKTIEFNQVNFALGQEETPASPARANFVVGRTTFDYQGMRLATIQEQRLVTGFVNRLRRVTLSQVSVSESNGTLTRDPASTAAGLGRMFSLELDQVMRAAMHHAEGITAVRPQTLRGEVADGITVIMGPDTVRVWFDRITGLPLATETLADDGVLGDRRTLTWYTRWQPAGPVKLARQVDVEVNGRLQSHTVVTSATVNEAVHGSVFTIPDSMRSRTAPPGPAAVVSVSLVNLAPGLWRAEGGSHHSLVVEQGNNLLVVEGPQGTTRSNAVLDTLAGRFKDRRVSAVVMTHHHHDHSGGIRGYLARGIPVIAHQRNVTFVRAIAAARKTVAPDRLSRGSAVPAVSAVRDSLVVGTGEGRVVLYPLPTAHAEGMLAAWHPASGTLFTSDVVSPAANQAPPRVGSAELTAFARVRKLAPRRYVGGHGVVLDWSAIEAASR